MPSVFVNYFSHNRGVVLAVLQLAYLPGGAPAQGALA